MTFVVSGNQTLFNILFDQTSTDLLFDRTSTDMLLIDQTSTDILFDLRTTPLTLDCVPGAKYRETADYELLKLVPAVIPEPYPEWAVALKVTAYVIAMTLGIAGNLAVLTVLGCSKVMRTTTNVYIANLAVCDLLVCCTCMWIHLGKNIRNNWPFGEFFCQFHAFSEGKKPIILPH